MKRQLVYFAALTLLLTGCAKKSEVENPAQELANSQMQTEFTLMQEGAAKASVTPATQAQQPALEGNTSVTAVAPVDAVPAAGALSEATTQNIQQALKNANLYSGKIDGDMGPKTKKAIRAFQEQNGLKGDGKVGPRTWTKLQPYLTQTVQTEPTLTHD